jgi:hypothetical protein
MEWTHQRRLAPRAKPRLAHWAICLGDDVRPNWKEQPTQPSLAGKQWVLSQEASVKEDIRAAIEKAAMEFDARADAAKQQRDKELIERQQFEAGYRRKRDDVILPGLGALTKILEPHEWTCKISDGETASTKLEVFAEI